MSVRDFKSNKYFVYIYRNKQGYPVYIGQGQEGERSLVHFGERAHNEALSDFIKQETVTVEAAGPLKTEDAARMVESALISAFRLTPSLSRSLKNVDPGSSIGRFRPLGVPLHFVDRSSERPLGVQDLLAASNGLPVVAVLITSKELSDRREGFEMARPPEDQTIINRMVKWWPIARREMRLWESEPDRKPALLIAMSGTINHRVIVAALQINRDPKVKWESAPKRPPKYRIPVTLIDNLDAANLRGRLVEKDTGRFNQSGVKVIRSENLA